MRVDISARTRQGARCGPGRVAAICYYSVQRSVRCGSQLGSVERGAGTSGTCLSASCEDCEASELYRAYTRVVSLRSRATLACRFSFCDLRGIAHSWCPSDFRSRQTSLECASGRRAGAVAAPRTGHGRTPVGRAAAAPAVRRESETRFSRARERSERKTESICVYTWGGPRRARHICSSRLLTPPRVPHARRLIEDNPTGPRAPAKSLVSESTRVTRRPRTRRTRGARRDTKSSSQCARERPQRHACRFTFTTA